jgi:general secretion pathway protein D
VPVSAPSSAPAIASTAAQLQWDGQSQLKTGDTFKLNLKLQSEQPVTSLPLAVGFDNKVLQVLDVTEGDFLQQGGAKTSFTSRVDANGQILMTGTRAGEGGASGSGSVATINFRALAPADASSVQLLTIAPVGLAGRTVAAALPAPHSVQVQP